jgi:hypothetical protein
MKTLPIVLVLLFGLSGCGYLVSKQDALSAARKAGLKNARVFESHQLAPAWFGCSENDSAGFEVEGINTNGERVEAIVCCGALLKGCTIRY